MATTDDLISVDLSPDERRLLKAALRDVGGPAYPDDAVAVAIGFANRRHMSDDVWRLTQAIELDAGLSPADWRRVQLTAEIVIGSDLVGSGLDWTSTSGISDADSIRILRGIQRKFLEQLSIRD